MHQPQAHHATQADEPQPCAARAPKDWHKRATALRQMSADERRFEFVSVHNLLENQRAEKVLNEHLYALCKPTARRPSGRDTPVTRAICQALVALYLAIRDDAAKVRDYGELLFAFEGTTVLQGGA